MNFLIHSVALLLIKIMMIIAINDTTKIEHQPQISYSAMSSFPHEHDAATDEHSGGDYNNIEVATVDYESGLHQSLGRNGNNSNSTKPMPQNNNNHTTTTNSNSCYTSTTTNTN